MPIRILILLFFITKVSSIRQCTANEKIRALIDCEVSFNQLFRLEAKYAEKPKNATFYHGMNSICEETMDCYKPLQCEEAFKYRIHIDEECDFKISKFPDNQECIVQFFKDSYAAQYSQNSCLSNFEFMHSNLTIRRTAYHTGKWCFMEYVRENCPEISVDYFSRRYEKITDVFSQPSDKNCTGERYWLKHLQCHASLDETKNRIENLNIFDGLFGSTRVDNVIKACKDTKVCIEGDNCFTSTVIPGEIERLCSGYKN